jgi:beta-mannosidase
MYLPSSPYIDLGVARYEVPEQHNWGARAYFKDDFYKHSKAHFISECGYHGCPATESLAKFIPVDKLWPYANSVWDTHNTDYLPKGARGYNRNRLMADQVRILFGFVPDNLEEFSLLSQVVQAEAKKFFVERTRIKKWRRTGVIWWNMLDGWPQISDAVVDYYFVKKRAFSYIKRVQEPICVMLDELVDWDHAVILGNDSRVSCTVSYELTDGDTGEILLCGTAHSPANENVRIGGIRVMAGEQRLIAGTLFGRSEPRIVRVDHYLVDFAPSGYMLVSLHIDKPGMIGRVGTLLGQHGINIAGMNVGRGQVGPGGQSVMVLALDNPIPSNVLDEILQIDGIMSADLVEL